MLLGLRAWAMLVVCCSAGCSQSSVEVQLPGDVTWAAVLLGAADGPRGSFERIDPARPLAIEVGAVSAAIEVRGFTAAGLGAAVDASAPVFGDRLRPAGACEPALPRPSYVASLTATTPLAVGGRDGLARVTADWIKDRCAHRSLPFSVVTTCSDTPCSFSMMDAGCGFTADGARCGAPSFCGVGLPGEPPSFEPLDRANCSATAVQLGADASFDCVVAGVHCQVDLRLGIEPPLAVAVSKETRALFGDVRYVPEGPLQVKGAPELLTGFVSDLVVLPDRLVVVHADGALIRPEECHAAVLEMLDLETLGTLQKVPAPDCLQALVRDPGGAFLGLAKTSSGAVVYRFDPDGRVIGRLALAMPDSGVGRQLRDPVILGNGQVYVGVSSLDPEGKVTGMDTLVALGPMLEATKPVRMVHEEFYFAAAGTGGELGFLDAAAGYVTVIDVVTEMNLRKTPSGHKGSGTALYHPESRRYVVSAYSSYVGLLILEPGRDEAVRVFYNDGPEAPLGMFLVPGHPGWVGVTLTDVLAPQPELKLAFLDPTRRLLLRGTQVLGRGVATRFEADTAGRVFTVLPWSGEVMRISIARE